jgi:hypothetical protein
VEKYATGGTSEMEAQMAHEEERKVVYSIVGFQEARIGV